MLAASGSLDAELTVKSQRRGSQRACARTPSKRTSVRGHHRPRSQDLKEKIDLMSAEMKRWRRLLAGVNYPGGMAGTGELVSSPST